MTIELETAVDVAEAVDVYVPVCVGVTADGRVTEAAADYDGTPWVGSAGPNDCVFVDERAEWESNHIDGPHAPAVQAAEEAVSIGVALYVAVMALNATATDSEIAEAVRKALRR